MTRRPRLRPALLAITLALLVGALLPAVASAAMGRMIGDDAALKDPWQRTTMLTAWKSMGGTHVRVTIEHRPGPTTGTGRTIQPLITPLTTYDAEIAAVHAAGLTPQVVLVWRGQKDAAKTARWMAAVARRYRADVRTVSVLNEPDLTIPVGGLCTVRRMQSLLESGALRSARSFGRSWSRTLRVETLDAPSRAALRNDCAVSLRGTAYRAIFLKASRAIRTAAPGTRVLAGETSAQPTFATFVQAVEPRTLKADGWAHHPYWMTLTPARATGGYAIGDLARVKALVGLPLHVTEFGYPHTGSALDREYRSIFTPSAVARVLPAAWRVAAKAKVVTMAQYGWFSPAASWDGTWNTALLGQPADAPTPAYTALARYFAATAG